MATIKTFIRVQKGSSTANVRFRVSDGREKQFFYKSSIKVDITTWDETKGEVSTRKICNPKYRQQTNKAILETKQKLLEVYERESKYLRTSEHLARAMLGQRFGTLESDSNLYDICGLINAYINETNLSKRSIEYYKALRTIFKHFAMIKEEQKEVNHFLNVPEIVVSDIETFATFITDEHNKAKIHPEVYNTKAFLELTKKGKEPKERSENTKIGYLKKLRAVLNFAARKGLISQNPMNFYKINREVYGTPFYLTKQERDYLYSYDLSEFPNLEKVRDLFILQCFCGCRISDMLRLTQKNIINGYLEYIPTKTKGKRAIVVRVPLHSIAKNIISKYAKGLRILPNFETDIKTNKEVSLIEYINRKLKDIFKMVGLCRLVVLLNPLTRDEEQKPLYEVASTHMARRTFIGLLYKQVKDPNIIASMSGHSQNSTAFARYRAIDDEIKSETINLL